MAVSPRDLLALTPEDQEAASKLEALVDAKLTANHEPGATSKLNLTLIADTAKVRLSYKLKKEIEGRYEKVGWTVSFEQNGLSDIIVLSDAPKKPVQTLEAPKSPNIVTVPSTGSRPVGPSDFPSDDDIMSEVLGQPIVRAEPAPTEYRPPSGTRPPVVTPMTRDDPENPYARSRLSHQ